MVRCLDLEVEVGEGRERGEGSVCGSRMRYSDLHMGGIFQQGEM